MLGLQTDLLRDVGLLAPLIVLHSAFWQEELRADPPMERRGPSRIVGQKFGAHHDLAGIYLAQGPGILCGHPNGGAAFLGNAGVIENQDTS